jgi:prevent-host-death family protein
MIVNATEFKNKVGKYLELASKEEIIIARNGKQIVKLVSVKDTPITDSLVGILKNDIEINLEKERMERLEKYDSSH